MFAWYVIVACAPPKKIEMNVDGRYDYVITYLIKISRKLELKMRTG